MDHWNYRIVVDAQENFGIRLVGYDQEGKIVAITRALAGVARETRDDMLEDLDRYTQASFDQPLHWEDDGIAEGIRNEEIEVITKTASVKDTIEWSDGKE